MEDFKLMLNVVYPKGFENEESRIGKKFNFFKVEPFQFPEKKEKLPEIKLGDTSDRISVLNNWGQNPQQGNILIRNHIFSESFSDIIECYLEDKIDEGYIIESTETNTE